MSLPSPADACARARERASLRLDGELSLIEAVSLRSHLRFCADCRQFAAGIEHAARELRSAPLEQPDLQLALPRRRYRSFASLAPVAVATAAAAAALLQVTQVGPGTLTGETGAAAAQSDAARLHAAYTEQRLARLFLKGQLVTRVQHTASTMN